MVLLNILKSYAKQNRLFSNLQFGFQEGVGYTEASFTILETIIIYDMLEIGSKLSFWCFVDVRKTFDTVWIDGLLYKLFSEFDIRNQLSLPSLSFADEIALLALCPTFLASVMGVCYKCSPEWRYEGMKELY